MKPPIPILDILFDFCLSRQEQPRWLSNQGLRAFMVGQPAGDRAQPLIVTERAHVLNFSTRWLALADLDIKSRYRLCEYALIRNRSPYNVIFLAVDDGLNALWACYRTLVSADVEHNLVHYMRACEQLSGYLEQPACLLALLADDQVFQAEAV